MLAPLSEQIERAALRASPAGAAHLLGVLPASLLVSLQRARFRRTLRLAAERSTFYREEFRRRGIDVRSIHHPAQLGDFYTTGDDLSRHGAEAFLTGRAETAFETTGTTSPVPKRIFFSQRELNSIGRASAAALYLIGIRRDDIVISAFDCSFWVSPAVVRSALQYLECFHVEAGKIDPLEFYDRARRYAPTVLLGEPSWIARLSEIAAERGAWPIKLLIAGGEGITDTARRAVERTWSAPLYINYGQTEAFGSLGVECHLQAGYHRNDLHFIFEIAESRAQEGELVYTTLTRDVMPLIRYRSSDVTHLVDEPCACGLSARRIARISGRCDEMVVCGMGNIGPWVFTEVLRDVPGARDEWQVVVGHGGRRDVIDLRVELAETSDAGELETAARANLRQRFPDFWKNLEMNLYDLRITPMPPSSLRQTRKLRRIVDARPTRR